MANDSAGLSTTIESHPRREARTIELVKIPEFGVMLTGADNYHEWVTEVKTYFELIDITNEYMIWVIVIGIYKEPDQEEEKAKGRAWKKK